MVQFHPLGLDLIVKSGRSRPKSCQNECEIVKTIASCVAKVTTAEKESRFRGRACFYILTILVSGKTITDKMFTIIHGTCIKKVNEVNVDFILDIIAVQAKELISEIEAIYCSVFGVNVSKVINSFL